jgi:hypothetical protein
MSIGRYSRQSRDLSEMSQTSQKSVKSINASLERIHTFGMSNIHKNKYDDKTEDQPEEDKGSPEQEGETNPPNQKKIVKTTSSSQFAKLKSAIS